MLLTDLQKANENNSNKIICKGSEFHFNPAAASLRVMAASEGVVCLAASEAQSQQQHMSDHLLLLKVKNCFKFRLLYTNATPHKQQTPWQQREAVKWLMTNEIIYCLRSYIFIAFCLFFLSNRIGHALSWRDGYCHIWLCLPSLLDVVSETNQELSAHRNHGSASGSHRCGWPNIWEQCQGGVQHHPRAALLLSGA